MIKVWLKEKRLVAICPEVTGGMPTPRLPSEIVGSGGGQAVLVNKASILNRAGFDVTAMYVAGAHAALALAEQQHIKMAILKARSPSCGNSTIYDGSFSNIKIPGSGVTAALLQEHQIHVFNETELDAAAAYLAELEHSIS